MNILTILIILSFSSQSLINAELELKEKGLNWLKTLL